AVEGGHQHVEPAENAAYVGLSAVHRLVQLGADRLDLLDPTATEDARQRAEHLLDLRVASRPGERDGGAVGEAADRRDARRRIQLDVLLAQQAGLAYVRD